MIKLFAWNLLPIVVFALLVNAHTRTSRQNGRTELEEYIATARYNVNQRYRPHYHVAGPVGWINDPNGFSFYKGQYHLFYQFYPYDSAWGPMHWGHVVSNDLVNWEQLPTALLPEEEMCFSGSAVQVEDQLVLMYTASIEKESTVNQSQYLAFSDDGVNFIKYEGNPVIPMAPNGSPDFRDPKVWKHEDHWYVVIGTKTADDRGRVLLYRSEDMKSWEYLSILAEADGDFGYMWECPDFFELGGKHILLISPQGMAPQEDRYRNVHQTGYIIGSFNYTTFEFIQEVGFQEVDFGHDFYAAQTTDENEKRYLVAWFSMWDVPYPEDQDGWAGALTIVRELSLNGDRILQKPVDSIVSLRKQPGYFENLAPNLGIHFGKAAEVLIEFDLSKNLELVLKDHNENNQAWVRWNASNQKVQVDRNNGDVRQVEWSPVGSRKWRMFLDASSMELFCGEGEVVFSSRIYPDKGWRLVNSSPQTISIELYQLKRSVPFYEALPSASLPQSIALPLLVISCLFLYFF